MKRKTLKLFACAAMMAMALSVTACGGSDKEDKAADTEATAGDEAAGADAADDKDAAGTDAADGADNVDAAGADAAADTDGTDAAGADAADGTDAAASGTTLEELFKDPSAKSAFDSMTQAMATDGMSASVSAVGNEMIVEVKIEDSSVITDGIGDTLAAAVDAQAETFKAQVKTLDTAVGQEGACTFTVRYLDPDGNVLTEKSFKAE